MYYVWCSPEVLFASFLLVSVGVYSFQRIVFCMCFVVRGIAKVMAVLFSLLFQLRKFENGEPTVTWCALFFFQITEEVSKKGLVLLMKNIHPVAAMHCSLLRFLQVEGLATLPLTAFDGGFLPVRLSTDVKWRVKKEAFTL